MKRRCVEVPKESGEAVIRRLDELGLREHDAKIESGDGSLLVPLASTPGFEAVEIIRNAAPGAEFTEAEFEPRDRGPETLEEALEGRLPEELLGAAPSSFDVIGDVAILDLPEELEGYGEEVGEALMETHPSVSTVLAKESSVEGEFRTRRHRLLAGEDRRVTVHREHGCEFEVDVEGAYFSPRLSAERERIYREVEPGESVVDMFAGVGPFAVEMARHREPERVVAVDKNPRAAELLEKNVERNGVEETVEPLLADAADLAEDYAGSADRVVMNLPKGARPFLQTALKLLKSCGGTIHYYEVTEDPATVEEELRVEARNSGREIVELSRRRVRSYSPEEAHWAFDLKVE